MRRRANGFDGVGWRGLIDREAAYGARVAVVLDRASHSALDSDRFFDDVTAAENGGGKQRRWWQRAKGAPAGRDVDGEGRWEVIPWLDGDGDGRAMVQEQADDSAVDVDRRTSRRRWQ